MRDSIKILIFASIISLTANYKFTDTTNAYRAYSARYLKDNRVQPLRDIFMTYELLAYLSVRATQIGMKACEIPVARVYPKTGKTPTKISFFKGNSELMKILLKNSPSLSSQSLFSCCSAMFSLFISNKSAVDYLNVLKR